MPTMPTPTRVPQDHRGGPRRPAPAHRRQDRRHARAVVPRGDARQHPPLRARHRRRQSAVVRSRLRRARRSYGGIVALPSFLFATSRIVSGYVGGLPGVHAMWSGADWTLAQAGAAQRRDHDRGLAQGPGRARDHVRRPRGPADLSRRFLQPARRPGRRGRQLVLPHRARPRARAGHQVQGSAARSAPRRYTDEELAELYKLYAEREDPRRRAALLGGRHGRRGAADDGQGPDDGDRLHRLRAGLGRPLHPRQQARLEADRRASRASASRTASASPTVPERVHWEEEFALEVGAPGAYDYGPERCSWLTHHLTNWMGDDGFLRSADLQDPPPQSGRRHAVHRGQGDAQVRRGRPPPGRDRAGGAQPGRRAVGRWAPASSSCPVARLMPWRRAGRRSRRRPVARAGRAAVHADAGRPRRRRDQGRAAVGRRDAPSRAAVRRGRRRGVFRRGQSRQARARRSTSRSPRAAPCWTRCSKTPTCWSRTSCRARWSAGASATRRWRRAIRACLLRHLRLRRRRAARRAAGLRRRAAGDVRPDERQRHAESPGRRGVGVPIVDHLTGYVALTGILLALYARERTGRGQRVEATLFDTGAQPARAARGQLVRARAARRGCSAARIPTSRPTTSSTPATASCSSASSTTASSAALRAHGPAGPRADDPRFATNAGRRAAPRRAAHRARADALRGFEVEELCRELMRTACRPAR